MDNSSTLFVLHEGTMRYDGETLGAMSTLHALLGEKTTEVQHGTVPVAEFDVRNEDRIHEIKAAMLGAADATNGRGPSHVPTRHART